MIGHRLSHFQITARLGEGGMGVVYRAQDVDLGRAVAVKLLPGAVATDPERMARFEREARVLASLNHPNVGAVYEVGRGVPEAPGPDGGNPAGEPVQFLVMELVEGEDLQQRLRRGAPPLAETRRVAAQIARALEAAHEKGIVHRDLKPANVMITPGGEVKVLDFGLAKAMDAASGEPDLSISPTVTAMSGTGVLLGTAAYMSPEQARGRDVDRRTDIWAFGCVLYEMLCGRAAFDGETVSDVLARILEREVDFDRLPAATPVPLRRLLKRCLEKDPARRLRDIGDAHWDLEADRDEEAAAGTGPAPGRRSWPALAAVFAAGLLAGAGLLRAVGPWPSRGTAPLNRFTLQIPPSDPYSVLQNSALALSPDGRTLAYAARSSDATALSDLHLRRFDSFEATAVPDTLGAYAPFFSPDGEWIGYFDGAGMWKKPVRGGPAVLLAPVAAMARGASWADAGRVFFAPSWYSPIFEVSADGGEPRPVTTLLANEKSHRFPSATADGSAVIFTISRADTDTFDDASVAMVSTATGEQKTLVDGATYGRLLPPDRLLYGRAGTLYAARLDLDRMEVVGTATPVLDDLLTSPTFGSAQLAVSANGTLVYLAGSPSLFDTRVVEVSRSGEVVDLPLPHRPYTMVQPSSDGTRLALRIDGANGHLRIYDLERGTLSRITREWDADFPVWSPDSESLAYVLSKGQSSQLARMRSDGTGEPEILWSGVNLTYTTWAPDGHSLVFTERSPTTHGDLWVLDLDAEPTVTPYLRTPADEVDPVVSPDGRWLAYTSNESGRSEIYVQAYPVPGRRWQISAQGGRTPGWSAADGELVFKNGDEIMAVSVELGARFEAGIPRSLFTVPNMLRADDTRTFAVSESGRYFAVLPPADWQPTGRLHLVLDWASTLD